MTSHCGYRSYQLGKPGAGWELFVSDGSVGPGPNRVTVATSVTDNLASTIPILVLLKQL